MAQAIRNARPQARENLLSKINLNIHEGWIAAILLAIMLVSVTSSVAAANWTEGLGVAIWAALGGMLFAMLCARLRLNLLLALILAVIVGAAFSSFLVSPHVGPADATWNEKMILIEDRVDQWLIRVVGGGVGTDAFVFLIMAAALAWLTGYFCAWSIFRYHQPWGAIIPAGAAILVNLFYAPPQSGIFLMLFLLTALLLLVRTSLLRKQQTWTYYAVRFAGDIGLDFLMYGVVFSGLIILLAWLIPPTAPGPQWFSGLFDRVRDPWTNIQQDVTRAFSTVKSPANSAPTTYFSNTLSMGGPIRLGSRPVFDVESEQGRYWRVVTFDKYTGTGWITTADTSASFLASDPRLKTPPMGMRRGISQTVEVLLPTDNLVVSASQPLRVSEPVDARFSVVKGSGDDTFVDLHSLRLDRPVTQGLKYEVASSLSGADEESLRAASNNVPAYVRERYLQLPAELPARVRALATQITRGATNNYDRARAIEQYLRQNIQYNDTVQAAPAGRDGVDYLLFDRPEGYCNYYASAMAVLARAVGIPARVSSGYAVARSDDGLFHINESNAHSWPELYIGDLGWIEFEPTASRPEIARPVKNQDTESNPELDATKTGENTDPAPGESRFDKEENQSTPSPENASPLASALAGTPGVAIAILLLAGVAFGATLAVAQYRWQRKLRGLPPAARALEEMYRFAPWAGFRDRPHATPDERAEHLSELMPDAREPIADVTGWYVRERYGAYALAPDEVTQAIELSRRLQPRVLGGIFDHYVGKHIHAAYLDLQAREQRLRARVGRFR